MISLSRGRKGGWREGRNVLLPTISSRPSLTVTSYAHLGKLFNLINDPSGNGHNSTTYLMGSYDVRIKLVNTCKAFNSVWHRISAL